MPRAAIVAFARWKRISTEEAERRFRELLDEMERKRGIKSPYALATAIFLGKAKRKRASIV